MIEAYKFLRLKDRQIIKSCAHDYSVTPLHRSRDIDQED